MKVNRLTAFHEYVNNVSALLRRAYDDGRTINVELTSPIVKTVEVEGWPTFAPSEDLKISINIHIAKT